MPWLCQTHLHLPIHITTYLEDKEEVPEDVWEVPEDELDKEEVPENELDKGEVPEDDLDKEEVPEDDVWEGISHPSPPH